MPAQTFSSWRAELELKYQYIHNRTVLAERRHVGPLHVQKSFYPEDEVCHTYILHPPGGVVGGDQLTISVCTEAQAHSLITTPASNKFYRSDNALSVVQQNLTVKSGATLEWLPQDSILFSGCRVKMRTRVDLEPEAKFIGWEITCFGRAAGEQPFVDGISQQSFELSRAGKLLHIERARIVGGSEILSVRWGMANYTVNGLMVVSNADKAMLEAARACEATDTCLTAITLKGELLLVRCLAYQGIEAREYFTQVWSLIRPLLCGREASVPRVWHT